jgi:hypothetical protein
MIPALYITRLQLLNVQLPGSSDLLEVYHIQHSGIRQPTLCQPNTPTTLEFMKILNTRWENHLAKLLSALLPYEFFNMHAVHAVVMEVVDYHFRPYALIRCHVTRNASCRFRYVQLSIKHSGCLEVSKKKPYRCYLYTASCDHRTVVMSSRSATKTSRDPPGVDPMQWDPNDGLP